MQPSKVVSNPITIPQPIFINIRFESYTAGGQLIGRLQTCTCKFLTQNNVDVDNFLQCFTGDDDCEGCW